MASSWDFYSSIPGQLRDWYKRKNPARSMVRNKEGGYTPVNPPRTMAPVAALPKAPVAPVARAPVDAGAPAYEVEPDPVSAAAAVRSRVATSSSAPAAAAPVAAAPAAGMENPFADAFQQQQDREDALAEASMGLIGLDDEKELLNKELGYADQWFNTEMPEGRQAGRVFVAANPLEFIGAAAKQIRGRKDRDKALDGIDAVIKKRQEKIGGVIKALRGRKKTPAIQGENDPEVWGLGG